MENSYFNLYIIGNGFDRYQDLQTGYKNFYSYIEKYDKKLLSKLSLYYDIRKPSEEMENVPDKTGWLWSDFEGALEYLDENYLIEFVDKIPYAGSDDPRDQDCDTVEGVAYNEISVLKGMLQNAFNDWVKSIVIDGNIKMKFADNSLFLSFNYTETLQKIYKIPDDRIVHIHNKVNDGKDLIFGHGWGYKKSVGKSYVSLYGRSVAVRNDIDQFLLTLYKDTERISYDYYDFFESLVNIKHICILGHSLSEIDRVYFERIAHAVNLNIVKWYVSCYDAKDKQNADNLRQNLNLPHIETFELENFQKCKSLVDNKILQLP